MTSEVGKVSEEMKNTGDDVDDIVNPWDVVSVSSKGVDYGKLISKLFCFETIS